MCAVYNTYIIKLIKTCYWQINIFVSIFLNSYDSQYLSKYKFHHTKSINNNMKQVPSTSSDNNVQMVVPCPTLIHTHISNILLANLKSI